MEAVMKECKYGCGREAKYPLKSNAELVCCESSYNRCPAIKKKNATGVSKAHKEGRCCSFSEKSWNKGLTAKTDERVNKTRVTLLSRIESGEIVPWMKGLNKYSDSRVAKQAKKLSSTIKRKVAEGTWHNSFSKIRTHEYKGMKFHGKWELAYAKWLDQQEIKWRKPEESFSYVFDGKERRYTPDFYLIDEACYIEIKGYETEKDRAKWSQFPLKLRVIKGEELFNMKLIDSYKNIPV